MLHLRPAVRAVVARLALILAAIGSALAPSLAAAADPPLLTVLALRGSAFFIASAVYDQAAVDALAQRSGRPIELYTEVIDQVRFDVDLDRELHALLKKKYAGTRLDLILASGTGALAFAERNRDLLFPGVPVVFYNVAEDRMRGRTLPPAFSGVTLEFNPAATLDLVTRLQPEVTHLVVVAGNADYDRGWLARVEPLLRANASRFTTTYLTDHSLPQVLEEVRRLGPGSAVFYLSMVRDAAGTRHLPRDAAKRLVEASAVPVYASIPGVVDQGVLGVWSPSHREQGTRAGELAARVVAANGAALGGREPPIPARCVLNWQAMQRFGISESLVPAGCSFRARAVPFWKQYFAYIVAALLVILLQALLITLLLVARARRRRSESQLRRSEELLGQALAAGRMGVWGWDVATRTMEWSAEHYTVMGVAPFSLKPTYREWSSRVHPADLPRVEATIERALADRADFFRYEYRTPLPDGTERWLDAQGHPVYDAQGTCTRITGLTVDVTERKRVEEANAHLVHVARLAVVGELTGSIAHEINQPLGAILSNAEAAELLLQASPVPLEEIRHIVEDIRRDDLRAGEIIRHMRALLRKGELAMEPFDLNQAITDVMHLVGAELARRHVTVAMDLGPLPPIRADRVHIQQVLLNLIHNGMDAMAELPFALRRLDIQTRRAGPDAASITVSDAGPGIAPERRARLFESFYTTKKDGLGLGLAIARNIVQAHGGQIEAERGARGGAMFRVVLPLQAGAASRGLPAGGDARFPATVGGGEPGPVR